MKRKRSKKVATKSKSSKSIFRTKAFFIIGIGVLACSLVFLHYTQRGLKTMPLNTATKEDSDPISKDTIEANSCTNTRWGFTISSPPIGWKCRLVQGGPPINFEKVSATEIYSERSSLSLLEIYSNELTIQIGQFSHDQVCQPKAMYKSGETCTTSTFYKDEDLILLLHRTMENQASSWTMTGYFYGNEKGCHNVRCQMIFVLQKPEISGDILETKSDQIVSILRSVQFTGM